MSIRITTNCSTHLRYSMDSRPQQDCARARSEYRSKTKTDIKSSRRRLNVKVGVSQLAQFKGTLPHYTGLSKSRGCSYTNSTTELDGFVNPRNLESSTPNYLLPCITKEKRRGGRNQLFKKSKKISQKNSLNNTKRLPMAMAMPFASKIKNQNNSSDVSTMAPSNNSSNFGTPIMMKRREYPHVNIQKSRRVGAQIRFLKRGLQGELILRKDGQYEDEGSLDEDREWTGPFEKCLSSIYYFLNSKPAAPRLELVQKKECPEFSEDYDSQKPLLVLDMDETLLHTEFTKKRLGYDVKIEDNEGHKYYVRFFTFFIFFSYKFQLNIILRPYLHLFLKQAKKYYNLVLFTASEEYYAKEVINYFDPKNEYFVAHLFRKHCVKSSDGVSISHKI